MTLKLDKSLLQPLSTEEKLEEEIFLPAMSIQQMRWQKLKRNKAAVAGLFILLFLAFFALFGPMLTDHSFFETNLPLKNQPPSKEFWFGSDDLGRDMFARTACGARISLFVGISAALIDLCVGVIWGGIAALAGGRIDNCLMRIADILYALPYLLVVIMLMVVMGSGLFPILIALTITGWIAMARIVRGQILQLKEQEFVISAIAIGASKGRILFKHLMPNAIGPILVTVTISIPLAIFTEAFLSFLGLGVQAPIASWGTMASDGLPAMRYYPWRLFFPALFISVTMLAFNLLGDGLRDALVPQRNQECF